MVNHIHLIILHVAAALLGCIAWLLIAAGKAALSRALVFGEMTERRAR